MPEQLERGTAVVDALDKAGILGQDRIVAAEIGVWNGELSEFLLREIPKLDLYMIDIWRPAPKGSMAQRTNQPGAASPRDNHEARKRNAILRTDFARDRRHIWRRESTDAAKRVQTGLLDFVFIDAGHSADAVYADLAAWFPRVRRQGLLCGHDIDHSNDAETTKHFGVRIGLDVFLSQYNIDSPVETGADTTWFIRKP